MRLIDADNLISVLDILSDKGGNIRYWEQLKQIVADCPTADIAEVRHGKWIEDEFGSRCGVCGSYAYRDKFDKPWKSPYCPLCGAKMVNKDD